MFQFGFGTVQPPPGVDQFAGGQAEGVPILVNILLRTLIVIAGVYAILQLILAGYGYISAGGDTKRIQESTAKIWQSILGLVVAAGAFVIAAVIGKILFGDSNALLQIQIFTP